MRGCEGGEEVGGVNYYEHHLGDWAAATGHLTWDEDMAYTRLLRAYYHHEKAIPDGQQYRLAKASTPSQRKAVDQVLSEFFQLRDGHYHQKRADAEIARFQDKQRKAKASAEARWSPSKRNANASPDEQPDAMRTHSEGNALQSPDTRHQSPKEREGSGTAQNAAPPTPPPDFDGTNAETLNGKSVVPLAAAWELPEQWGVDAEALGWKPSEVLREAEKFRQYWVAGKGLGTRRAVKSWRQTWSNWLEKAAKEKR